MAIKWEDTTSYSRRAERIPTCFTAKAGALRITVTSGHIHYRGTGAWVMHCAPFYDTHKLPGVETEEQAKAVAIRLVMAKVKEITEALK